MKIRRIAAYRVELPLHEGSYKWSGGKSVAVFDSTLVRVETDGGLVGHGEVCPLGPAYLPAYAEGVRAGLAVLAPQPDRRGSPGAREAQPPHGRRAEGPSLREVRRRHRVLGHPRAGGGSPGRDAARRALRRGLRPLSRDLAGVARGNGSDGRGIPRRGLPALPAQGRRRPRRRRRAHPGRARRARAGRRSSSPTPTRAGCRTRRRASCGRSATSTSTSSSPARPTRSASRSAGARTIRSCSTRRSTASDVLLRAAADNAMDVVNLKISKLGGLTRARQARDLCVGLGVGHDDRGLLGRRRDDGRDRPPRAFARRPSFSSPRPTSTATSRSRPRPARRSGRTDGCPPRRRPASASRPGRSL